MVVAIHWSDILNEETDMKKLIKNTAFAIAFASVVGGTWAASGAYHSSSGDSNIKEAVFVQNVNFTTDALMTSLNEKSEFDMIQTVKSVLAPVKNYFFEGEGATFNGIPVHKACVSVRGSTTINGVTRWF